MTHKKSSCPIPSYPTPSDHIVLVAGGTGGHVFPALAVSQVLCERKHTVSLMTDQRGVSYTKGLQLQKTYLLSTPPFSGSLFRKGLALGGFLIGFVNSLFFLRKQKPNLVWGFGGQASIAPLLAAWVLRIPRGIHQADALLGRANRFLTRFVFDLATSFPVVEGVPSGIRQTYTGLPIRLEIEALAKAPYPSRHPQDPFHLLVVGGSQGASLWGRRLPQAIAKLPLEKQSLFRILHQCRPEFTQQTQQAYAQTAAVATLTPFIHSIADALKKAHFVMARAGASTLMELAASGRPALFVPYPFATDDHQTINAQKAVEQGGCAMIAEKDFTVEWLRDFLEEILEPSSKLIQNRQNTKYIWQGCAAQHLANLMEECLKKGDNVP